MLNKIHNIKTIFDKSKVYFIITVLPHQQTLDFRLAFKIKCVFQFAKYIQNRKRLKI